VSAETAREPELAAGAASRDGVVCDADELDETAAPVDTCVDGAVALTGLGAGSGVGRDAALVGAA
jgi:hypothetical protein